MLDQQSRAGKGEFVTYLTGAAAAYRWAGGTKEIGEAGSIYCPPSEAKLDGRGYAKIALQEGFHDWVLPSFAVRGSVSQLLGTDQVKLTVWGLDVLASKAFGIGGTAKIEPFLGWNILFIDARSGVIDTTPKCDAYAQRQAAPVAPQRQAAPVAPRPSAPPAAAAPPRTRTLSMPPKPPLIWRAATGCPAWPGSPGYSTSSTPGLDDSASAICCADRQARSTRGNRVRMPRSRR